MPKHEIARREALVKGSKIGVGLLGAYLGVRASSDPKETASQVAEAMLRKRVVDFSAEGRSFRGIFWAHGQGGIGQGRINPEDVVAGRYTVLESAYDYLNPDFGIGMVYDQATQDVILSDSLGVILNDCSLDRLTGVASEVSPLLAAVGLTFLQVPKLIKRRALLCRAVKLGTGWAAISGARPILSLLDFSPDMAHELARMNYFIELANPESFVSTFRNALVAYKTLDLEQDVNLVFGKGHWSLPFYMQSGRSSLFNYLRRYPSEWLDQFVTDRRYLYTSQFHTKTKSERYKPSLAEHPRLKQLFT